MNVAPEATVVTVEVPKKSMLAVTVPSLIEVFSVAYVYPSGSSGVGSGSPVQPSEQLLKAAEASREKGRRNVKNFS